MGTRVSELKDGVNYKTEREGDEFVFTSHSPTTAMAYGIQFSIRKQGGYWQVLDREQLSGNIYWDYLTEIKEKPRWRAGRRKTRKLRRKNKKATRYLKR